ncbi:hypothetical protein ABBQ38_000573 [Trebouxia sp. C0009 RCD-2024]
MGKYPSQGEVMCCRKFSSFLSMLLSTLRTTTVHLHRLPSAGLSAKGLHPAAASARLSTSAELPATAGIPSTTEVSQATTITAAAQYFKLLRFLETAKQIAQQQAAEEVKQAQAVLVRVWHACALVEEAAKETKEVEAAWEAIILIAANGAAGTELPDNEMAGNSVYSQDADQDEEDLATPVLLKILLVGRDV